MLAPAYVTLGVALVALSGATLALKCLGMDNSTITTIPSGDIAIEYNKDPLEIFCMVEPPYNSKQIRFVRRVYNSSSKPLGEVHIMNETTAKLYIARPERQNSNIECELLKVPPVRSCFNKVVVDSGPEDVFDFQCRSYNLQRLECKWRTPVHYLNTIYKLDYLTYGSPINACTPKHLDNDYTCTLNAVGDSTKQDAHYRTQEDFFDFILTSMNRFGNNTQHFRINHYANLIPGKPTNLVKSNLSTHSVVLQWRIPQDVADFSKGVDTKISYQIKTVDNLTVWRSADMSQLHKVTNSRNFSYLLKDLPYAHWSYDVRVFIKSILAPDEEEFWSDFQATTFLTKSERPPFPPRTELGAFVSMKRGMTRDVYVYWQQVDEFYESGENFTYNVQVLDGANMQTLLSNKSSYIHFTASLQPLNVSIASSNNLGQSRDKSYIYIPPDSYLLRLPTSFTKTVYGNKTYDLRWQPPKDTEFDSYTVFWCSNTDVEQCSGKLNFITLSHTATSHRVMVSEDDKTYMFAISANRGHLSSGMVWGTCNLPAENATNKVNVFKRGPVRRRSVELQWDLGCSFSEGHVKGYNVTYCPRADPSHCSSAHEKFLVIDDPQQKMVNVTGLMPHTTYSFHISVIYKDGLGYSSDSVDATTLEDKPSEPLNIRISNVTAHTMHVSWDPPALKNGILLEYKVKYFENDNETTTREAKIHVDVAEKSAQHKDKRQEVLLTGLQAFTNYTVRVLACTTDCSDGTMAGQVRTAIGAPSLIGNVSLFKDNLQWNAPEFPGGTLDLYEGRILGSDNTLLYSFNSSAQLLQNIPQCDLSDDDHTDLYYRVRAVNYDVEKDHGVRAFRGNVSYIEESEPFPERVYRGPWSEPAIIKCGKPTSTVLFWILGIIFAVAFVVMFSLGSRKFYIWYNKKSKIEVNLPPGLGPYEEKDSLGARWSPPATEDKSFATSAGDEVRLLKPQRRADDKTFTSSSDSTDSTTLSLTSKEPREREASTSDDASDVSSLRDRAPEPSEPSCPVSSTGYAPFATHVMNFSSQDYSLDNDLTVSDDLAETGPSSGYVQSAPLSFVTPQPIHNLPVGYVMAQDPSRLTSPPHITTSFPLPTVPKSTTSDHPLMPKLLPMDWKLPEITRMDTRSGELTKPTAVQMPAPSQAKPSSGYVSHSDSIINKHLNIMSSNQEEPALPDPNMSPEAYCRFGWNPDPSADINLHTLLQGHHEPTTSD